MGAISEVWVSDKALPEMGFTLDTLSEALEPLYGFRSLESFTATFKPRDVPLSLVLRDEAALPRIGLALTEAFLPGTPLPKLALAGVQGLRAAQD